METHVTKATLGAGLTLQFTADVSTGQVLDTKVEVAAGDYLCTVAGGEQLAFLLALQEVVARYRI